MTNVVARLLAKRIWTPSRTDCLVGDTLTTLTKLGRAFDTKEVPLENGGVAWGQYLDENHFSRKQWGFYGTSAALQTLAVRARSRGTLPSEDSEIRRAVELPLDQATSDPVFESKRRAGKEDFRNVIKLAFIADALALDDEESVPAAATPPLVKDLMDLAVSGERWSTRLPDDDDRFTKDQDFPTAFIVSVLRRYDKFRRSPLWERSRLWLANRVLQDGAFREQKTLLALTGLALLPHPGLPAEDPSPVTSALDMCERELIRWIHTQTIVLNRPVFNGFSIGERNDYVFLHPELLVALFLLRRNSPPRGRRFVLDVVNALERNVAPRERAGFMGQDGMITSVDQLWAARLIQEFQRARKAPEGIDRLLPRPDAYAVPHTRKTAWFWIAVLLATAIALSLFVNGWVGVVPVALGLVFFLIGRIRPQR